MKQMRIKDDSCHIDRLSIMSPPPEQPAVHQSWGKLLFMHWPINAELLRPLIPSQLEIDTYRGQAWIAVVPFTMWNIRLHWLPALPYVNKAHELNVRTYVHYNGVPGVWFFSLDLNQSLGVFFGRHVYHVPYFKAGINLNQEDRTIHYDLIRSGSKQPAEFAASWTIGKPLRESMPDSLEFFLTERYCLYSANGKHLYRARIWHDRWPLQEATLSHLRSSMIESFDLPSPVTEPLLHYAESLDVQIWWLERLSDPNSSKK